VKKVNKKKRTNFHIDMKRKINQERLFQKYKMHSLPDEPENKFTEVRLPIVGVDLNRNGEKSRRNLPVADAGGKINDDSFVFVEFDSGGQISHTLLKFLYFLENSEIRLKRLYLFHIYGKEFSRCKDPNKQNYLFHRKLVDYLRDRIKERCVATEFTYIKLMDEKGFGFTSADKAYERLKGEFKLIFSD